MGPSEIYESFDRILRLRHRFVRLFICRRGKTGGSALQDFSPSLGEGKKQLDVEGSRISGRVEYHGNAEACR